MLKSHRIPKRIIDTLFVGGLFYLIFGTIAPIWSSELVHEFGNPSFSGINQSAHYLTIDEQERTRAEKRAQDIQDKLDEEVREADNTVLARFVRNLESRIYSTLAKDLSESLFNYDGIPTSENPIIGEINLEGNILRWVNDGASISLTVEEWFDGVLVSTTEIVIPVGDFGGCWSECE
jgi:hypothetical protein